MIRQKLRAAALQTIKQCVRHRPITLQIWDGPLKGRRWRFDVSSNNEVILGFWEHNIQVDVECAELDALVGAERLLNTRHPLMYLETHNLHNPGVDRLCLGFLDRAGYRIVETIDQTSDRSAASYILSTP